MNAALARHVAHKIVGILQDSGHTALLAGGCVRDSLLGRTPKDYDVVTDASPEEVCALFRRTEQVGAQFGVVIVRMRGCMIEVATFRTDGDYADGRHPDSVRFATAEEDARRRDFTINGMFMNPVDGRVIDLVGGQADLGDGLVRAIGDPRQRFAEDHLRLLRAVRFAAALDFEIEPATLAAICEHAGRIVEISAERIQQELERILSSPNPSRGWRLLVDSGLADFVFGDERWTAVESKEVAARLAVLPNEAGFSLALAVVLRLCTPQTAAKVCRRLRCSNQVESSVAWFLRNLEPLLRPAELELADVKLLMADARFDDLANLLYAECVGCGGPTEPHDRLMGRAAEIPADLVAPEPLLTGNDLAALNVPPGPVYKHVLDAVYRAQLNEQLSDHESALGLARGLLAGGGGQRP
ncbi:MAG: CCA tRNA nucleotidyltransferase [bacterium]|nr:CCA tRNA nucleotidyltransferase [bacterium]